MAIDPGRVKALFQAAIGRVDSADRRAFLDGETGDDAELRARLDALLAAHDRPQSVLDRPLDADPRATFPDPGASGESSPQEPGRIDAGDATESQAVEEGPTPLDTLIAGRFKLRQENRRRGDGHRLSRRANTTRPADGRPQAGQAGDEHPQRPGPVQSPSRRRWP